MLGLEEDTSSRGKNTSWCDHLEEKSTTALTQTTCPIKLPPLDVELDVPLFVSYLLDLSSPSTSLSWVSNIYVQELVWNI